MIAETALIKFINLWVELPEMRSRQWIRSAIHEKQKFLKIVTSNFSKKEKTTLEMVSALSNLAILVKNEEIRK